MHTAKRLRTRPPIIPRSMVGHPYKFPDGFYYCKGVYGSNKETALQMAEEIAKRYNTKTRVTEKMIKVDGEHGTVKRAHYLIWEISPMEIGKFGVDTAEKAKERELAKLEKTKLEKKRAAEEAKAEALRKKLRAMGQHTLSEAGVKTFKHW